MRIPTATVVTLAVAGAIAAAGSGYAAGPTFSSGPPVVAPAVLYPADPAVAIGPSGAQVLVFVGHPSGGYGIFARSRQRAGGPWEELTRLSTSRARPLQPVVAVAPTGAAVVVWRVPGGAVLSALRPDPAEAWVRLPVVSDGAGFGSPDVTFGSSTATVAWGEGSGTSQRVRVATLDLASRRWTMAAALAVDGPPSITVGAGGDVGTSWSGSPGSPGPVRATLRLAGSDEWQPPALLTASGAGPTTAVAPNGATIVAWQEVAGTLPGTSWPAFRVRSAIRPAGAPGWSAPEDLAGGVLAGSPQVAINSAGDAIATWLPPGAAELDMSRRSGADGTWGPPVTLDRIEFAAEGAAVALDDLGNAFIAWLDPEGPGSASLLGWVGPRPAGAPLGVLGMGVGGNGERFVIATSGRGDALLASTRSLPDEPLSADVVAVPLRADVCATVRPGPSETVNGTVTLSAAQLRINQRIAAAAVRRANAIEAWLDGRVESRDICGGGIVSSALGPGLSIGPPTTARTMSPPRPRPLRIAPAEPNPHAHFTLSATQLRINQRIASRAVRQANALAERLDRGLSGGDLAPGAITPEKLAPTIALTRALAAPAPAPTRTALAPAEAKRGVTFTVSAAQLQITQRISQAAIRRLNALRDRLATGLTASDLRSASITAANIAKGSVPTP